MPYSRGSSGTHCWASPYDTWQSCSKANCHVCIADLIFKHGTIVVIAAFLCIHRWSRPYSRGSIGACRWAPRSGGRTACCQAAACCSAPSNAPSSGNRKIEKVQLLCPYTLKPMPCAPGGGGSETRFPLHLEISHLENKIAGYLTGCCQCLLRWAAETRPFRGSDLC